MVRKFLMCGVRARSRFVSYRRLRIRPALMVYTHDKALLIDRSCRRFAVALSILLLRRFRPLQIVDSVIPSAGVLNASLNTWWNLVFLRNGHVVDCVCGYFIRL
jgi:hypothetical protein